MLSVAVEVPPPVIVKLHVPAATGVTRKAAPPPPVTGDPIVAMPVQFVVDDANVPGKFVCVTVTLCAFAAPVAVNDKLVFESITAPGVGVGDGDGDGVGVGGFGGTVYGVVHATNTSKSNAIRAAVRSFICTSPKAH
jgi:hypothetical protein